jgi:hypothetical protein
MSEKFTKGPWNANFTRFSGWVVGFHITDLEHGSLRPICEAYDKTGAMNPNEIAANARLIAAAPELLDALKACAAVCAGEVMHKNGLVNALEKARAAIAKATGATHE